MVVGSNLWSHPIDSTHILPRSAIFKVLEAPSIRRFINLPPQVTLDQKLFFPRPHFPHFS